MNSRTHREPNFHQWVWSNRISSHPIRKMYQINKLNVFLEVDYNLWVTSNGVTDWLKCKVFHLPTMACSGFPAQCLTNAIHQELRYSILTRWCLVVQRKQTNQPELFTRLQKNPSFYKQFMDMHTPTKGENGRWNYFASSTMYTWSNLWQ